jgi:hypothetical protein
MYRSYNTFIDSIVVDQEFSSCSSGSGFLILVDIKMNSANCVPVPNDMVVPRFILLSAHTGTGNIMAVVIEQVGFNECISAIQVDPVSLAAGLVVMDIIVMDVCSIALS